MSRAVRGRAWDHRPSTMGCNASKPTAAQLEALRLDAEKADKERKAEAIKAKRAEEARLINEQIKATALAKKAKASGGANSNSSNYKLSGYTPEQLEELRGHTAKLNAHAAAVEAKREEERRRAEAEAAMLAAMAAERAERASHAAGRVSHTTEEVGYWRWAYEHVRAYLDEMTPDEKAHYFKAIADQQGGATPAATKPHGHAHGGLLDNAAHALHLDSAAHVISDGAHALVTGLGKLRMTGRRLALGSRLGKRGLPKPAATAKPNAYLATAAAAPQTPAEARAAVAQALHVLTHADLPSVVQAVGELGAEEAASLHRISRATAPTLNAAAAEPLPTTAAAASAGVPSTNSPTARRSGSRPPLAGAVGSSSVDEIARTTAHRSMEMPSSSMEMRSRSMEMPSSHVMDRDANEDEDLAPRSRPSIVRHGHAHERLSHVPRVSVNWEGGDLIAQMEQTSKRWIDEVGSRLSGLTVSKPPPRATPHSTQSL